MITSTQPLLDLTVVCAGSRWRVVVRGELDLTSGRDLTDVARILAAARADIADSVDVDLAGVTFIDSAGWHAVVAFCAIIREAGGDVELVTRSESVTRFLRLSGLIREPAPAAA